MEEGLETGARQWKEGHFRKRHIVPQGGLGSLGEEKRSEQGCPLCGRKEQGEVLG